MKLNAVKETIGYTGHAYDASTSLTYAKARYYDAQVGHFLATDPKDFKDADPFSFNRYSYARRYFHPGGREHTKAFCVPRVDAAKLLILAI